MVMRAIKNQLEKLSAACFQTWAIGGMREFQFLFTHEALLVLKDVWWVKTRSRRRIPIISTLFIRSREALVDWLNYSVNMWISSFWNKKLIRGNSREAFETLEINCGWLSQSLWQLLWIRSWVTCPHLKILSQLKFNLETVFRRRLPL